MRTATTSWAAGSRRRGDAERDVADDFMQGMHAAHARLDAYAANPYPSSTRETPFADPCSWCKTLTMARLPQIRSLVTELFGAASRCG